jgi:galactose oxidase-like protein/Big-like domain-containing protein
MKTDRPFWALALVALAAIVLVSTAQPANAAVGFVQAAGSTNDAPATTIAQAFSAANTAGNLIVVGVSWGDNPAPSIRATDTLGNTYSVVTNDFDPGNRQGLAILYAPNIRAGANTVTVTLGVTGGYRRIIVSEYSGIATTSPLDVSAHNRATGTTAANGVTSTAATTTANGDLIFGVVMDDSGSFGTITAGTGFTVRATLNGMDMATEDAIQGTAGPVAATFTFSRADIYLAQMAAFKAAPSGSPAVSSLVCNPTTLNPGASTTCTVTLNQPAPGGGSTVTLASSNTTALPAPASVTVPASASSTTFTPTAGSVSTAQTVTLTATLGGSTTATVTVTPSLTLTSLAVTPTNPSIGTGATQQFTATGTFSDGSTQDLTTSATWASSAAAVATISNAVGSQGRATGVGTGSTTITATSGSVSGSTILTVTGGGGGGPITFVQANASTNDAAAATIAQAFPTANTAGNLIVVAVSWSDNPAPSMRATDTLGNTYSIATNDFDPGNRQGLAILYAPNIRAGANTVTVTLGITGGYRRIIVSEYSGIVTTSPLDAAAANRATGTTTANAITSTTATTTANGDLIFGVVMDDSGNFGTITAGTGFTVRATLNGMDLASEDKIQGTAGPVAATFTFSRADVYLAQMAAFKAAAGGGGGSPAVSSLVCNPTTLNPGASTTCTVTLNQPAPSGGSTVTLASNNTTALPVPASVTVPASASSTTFTATAGSVSTAQTVTLTATLGGSATATVTVTPTLTLTSLAVTPTNPSIVTGGTQQFTATGTFSDGSTQNLTTSVTWASSITAVATISNTTGSQGRATGVGTGSTTISATSGSVSGSTVLSVTGSGGGGPITFVQANASTDNAAASTIVQAFSSPNAAGNLIVVAVSWGDNDAPSIRATDTLGNTYSVASIDFDAGNRQGVAILYAPNIRAGANTVTVTLGTTGGYRRIIVSEYSGIATTSPLDAAARSHAGGTTAANGVTSTAATTIANGDLIVGVAMDDSGNFGTISAGSGFTRRMTLNGMDMATEDGIQSAAGAVAATFTFSRADTYLAQMAAFKAAPGGGGGGGPALSSIACNPSSLASGSSTTCTVSLNQNAPANGITVALNSNNPSALPVPASVTVPANSASTTFTSTAGSVTSIQNVTVIATLNAASTSTMVTVVSNQAQLKGAWAGPFTWPLVAIHMVLLPNGKVLTWDLVGPSQQVWDPASNTFTDVTDTTVNFNYFCAGQTMLGDGRVLVDGGHIDYDIGVTQVHAFNPVTNTWSALAQMSSARWYPTVITLGDGRALAVAGHTTCSTCVASTPEVYDPVANTWSRLTGAQSSSPTQYPHVFVIPDGRAVVAGSSEEVVPTSVINVAGNTITTVDPNPRQGGSAVMYSPGKIMKAGSAWDDGQANVGATTYVIDMTQPSPAWRQTANMAFARVTHNLTILADGSVMVTGGSGNANVSDPALAVYAGEIWSPTTETWSTTAAMQVGRVYHATAILLPDGRLLSAGSGRFGGTGPGADQLSAEIYSPPYLFNGSRPTITSAPTAITYGSQFTVNTPDAAQISKVSLIRAGSVTHHFNGGQRYVPLSFQQNAGSLTITAPANGNVAPPGYYMLFILNANGVPSIAPLIQVH